MQHILLNNVLLQLSEEIGQIILTLLNTTSTVSWDGELKAAGYNSCQLFSCIWSRPDRPGRYQLANGPAFARNINDCIQIYQIYLPQKQSRASSCKLSWCQWIVQWRPKRLPPKTRWHQEQTEPITQSKSIAQATTPSRYRKRFLLPPKHANTTTTDWWIVPGIRSPRVLIEQFSNKLSRTTDSAWGSIFPCTFFAFYCNRSYVDTRTVFTTQCQGRHLTTNTRSM